MEIVIGKGVKLEQAKDALAKSAGELIDGEVVWYFTKCNNLKPMTNAIVITNARVLGLSAGRGFKFAVMHSHITSTSYDEKRGTVQVSGGDGEMMTFKSVASEDVPAVAHYIEYGRQTPIPDVVATGLAAKAQAQAQAKSDASRAAVERQESERLAADEKRDLKAGKRERKEQEKAKRLQEREERAADELASYGRMVAVEVFGMHTVRIYDKGFVRVSGILFGSNTGFEQLISIEASSDVSKKSGAGRGAAALMTGGLSLASSNKRGDVYLTITTDATTHVLHEDPPTATNLKQVKRLEAAGLAVLRQTPSVTTDLSETPTATQAASGAPTVSERLRELTLLRDEGLVSLEEYDQLRAKLLGTI